MEGGSWEGPFSGYFFVLVVCSALNFKSGFEGKSPDLGKEVDLAGVLVQNCRERRTDLCSSNGRFDSSLDLVVMRVGVAFLVGYRIRQFSEVIYECCTRPCHLSAYTSERNCARRLGTTQSITVRIIPLTVVIEENCS